MESTMERCEGVDFTRVRKLQRSGGAMERKIGSETMFQQARKLLLRMHKTRSKRYNFFHMC